MIIILQVATGTAPHRSGENHEHASRRPGAAAAEISRHPPGPRSGLPALPCCWCRSTRPCCMRHSAPCARVSLRLGSGSVLGTQCLHGHLCSDADSSWRPGRCPWPQAHVPAWRGDIPARFRRLAAPPARSPADRGPGVQAVGAALLTPASLSLILDAFPQNKRAVAVSLWGAVGGMAAAIGPSLGSLIVDSMGWQWAFYINLPIGAVSLVLGLCAAQESRIPGKVQHVDLPACCCWW